MAYQLNEKEFNLLAEIEKSDRPLTQRDLSESMGFSVGTVNKLLGKLVTEGLVQDSRITELGLETLEPYRVQRAIFIAAGFGERMVPITLNTPKPLVRVKGARIIDSLLDAVINVGIEEIYIVRGYLGEQFDQLLYKYPSIKFIENPMFNQANNISSIYFAREFLDNAYVLESDCLLKNPNLITKYQYRSNYLAIPVKRTDDWCFHMKHGFINEVSIGGEDCYQMCGISYWTNEDGEKLKRDVPLVMDRPGGHERYWDEVPLRYCKDNYNVAVRDCRLEDIVEIDTFKELQKIDPDYA